MSISLEELLNEWDLDSNIDKNKIDHEALKIPKLHHKYFRYLLKEKHVFKKGTVELSELRLKKIMYYSGKATAQEYKEKPFDLKVLKGDLHEYLSADKDINKLALILSAQEEKVKFLEDILKSIHNRNFILKNYIEWQRFQAGS